MAWKIKFSLKADKEMSKFTHQTRKLIRNYLRYNVLKQTHPNHLGKALRGKKKGLWRYRVDKFRIICKLEEDKPVILIVKIAKRDVVYED
jgi:mRNA interferase RelE/StbE